MDVKSILSKAGLVEGLPKEPYISPDSVIAPVIEIVTKSNEDKMPQTLEEFYYEKGFTEDGVYQLKAIMDTIPASISDADKIKMVRGILGASKLDLDVFLMDAENREEALKAYIAKVTTEVANIIENNNAAILALQEEIKRYQKDTQVRTEYRESITRDFSAEIEKITKIISPYKGEIK